MHLIRPLTTSRPSRLPFIAHLIVCIVPQVRSTQTLSLLSEALKLSLLLSKSPDPALNDEAVELIKSTEAEKLRCALLLGEIMGLDVGKAEQLVNDMDRTFIKTHTATEDPEDDEMEDVSAG